jgi:hypothetical protein
MARRSRHQRRTMLTGGYGWPKVKCHRCGTKANLPHDLLIEPPDGEMKAASLNIRSVNRIRWRPRCSWMAERPTRDGPRKP